MQSAGLWGGLHRSDLTLNEADIVVAGIPYDGGVSFRSGARDGPQAVRSITLTAPPTTERFEDLSQVRVLDVGDVEGASREEIFRRADELTARLVHAGRFFTFIGGDHSVTIPILQGVDRAISGSLGIIHLDAHMDLCEHMGGNRFSHGSTARRALELTSVGSLANCFFAGVRSIEREELCFVNHPQLNIISARQLCQLGAVTAGRRIVETLRHCQHVYLTIDIDVLDPAYAPGTGTPQFGGLNGRELLDLLETVFSLPILGFDVVEVAPSLDASTITAFAARKLIFECWGHFWRKKRR